MKETNELNPVSEKVVGPRPEVEPPCPAVAALLWFPGLGGEPRTGQREGRERSDEHRRVLAGRAERQPVQRLRGNPGGAMQDLQIRSGSDDSRTGDGGPAQDRGESSQVCLPKRPALYPPERIAGHAAQAQAAARRRPTSGPGRPAQPHAGAAVQGSVAAPPGASPAVWPRAKVKESCWCILVDAHEMGFMPVTDEEFVRSLHPDENPDVWVSEEKWIAPAWGICGRSLIR